VEPASRALGVSPVDQLRHGVAAGGPEIEDGTGGQVVGRDGKTVQQRYDRALEYLDSIEEKSAEMCEMERILRG